MSVIRGSLREFLVDIEPFFYGRRITYVDIGAYTGEIFKQFLDSQLKIREAHLVEPNPESFETLKANVIPLFNGSLNFHNVAVGNTRGAVHLRSALSMTKVIPSENKSGLSEEVSGNVIEVSCLSLDELADSITENHISILKVDVEGFEEQVLNGAENLLKNQNVDVLYIEAGMNPDGTQQCYYRDIEDIMLKHGYRLFRTYEQMFEWMDDSPFLRRVNLAYMSESFADKNPYRLTHELFDLKRKLKKIKLDSTATNGALEKIKTLQVQTVQERDDLKDRLDMLTSEHHVLSERHNDCRVSQVQTVQERDDLKDRLDMLTSEHHVLSERHNDCRVSQVQAAQENNDLKDCLAVLKSEHHALSDCHNGYQVLQAQTAQECDDLKNQLRSLDTAHIVMQQKLEQVQGLCSELEKKNKQSAKRLKTAINSLEVSEEVSRSVYRLYDQLYANEMAAQGEAYLTSQRVERTKQHLSYLLGATIISNSRSLVGWLKMPFALKRAYGDYCNYRAEFTSHDGYRKHSVKLVAGVSRDLSMPLKPSWQEVLLFNDGQPCEIWAKILPVKAYGEIKLGLRLSSLEKTESGDAKKKNDALIAQETLSLANRPVMLKKIFPKNGNTVLKVKKIRGVPCVIVLELRKMVDDSQSKRINRLSTNDKKISVESLEFPKPMKSAVIWQAHQMFLEGKQGLAIEFALKYSRDFVCPAVSLLQANQVTHDENLWLGHVNKYIKQFNIAPLELRPKEGDKGLFARFFARPQHLETEGPLVSIIMPAFNAQDTLEFAVRSILEQTWYSLELIIVDDCSDDSTWEIAQTLSHIDSRIKIQRNSVNVGPYVSKNIALSLANGSYITGHDADDWAHPERIERQVKAMLTENSKGRVLASLARMIRLTSAGMFNTIAKEGKTSDDGVLRDASISCMFEAKFLRETLGGWDSVRFGADSEIIARARLILGSDFVELRQLSMLCLDEVGSLTNHPIHGVSRVHGISPSRKFYRDQWSEWHKSITKETAYLPFPHVTRIFEAPEAATVENETINMLLPES